MTKPGATRHYLRQAYLDASGLRIRSMEQAGRTRHIFTYKRPVDDQMVERTIQRIAQENKITPDELKKALDREKISYAKYREDIRREVTIQRLREREVDSKVQVSEAEVDNYLATVAA